MAMGIKFPRVSKLAKLLTDRGFTYCFPQQEVPTFPWSWVLIPANAQEKAALLSYVPSPQGEGQEWRAMGEAFLAFPGQQKS